MTRIFAFLLLACSLAAPDLALAQKAAVSALPGKQGPAGPKGDRGDPGAPSTVPGPAGKDGKDGSPGGTGPAGTAATITIGSVTTGSPSTPAAVINSGSPSAAVFDFTIPRALPGTNGVDGAAGPAGTSPSLSIGTVTTLAPGSAATATMSGTTAAPKLNLGIPAGNTGSAGATGGTGATGATGSTGATGAAGTAGVNAFASPVARTVAVGTAYQATTITKPAMVSVTITSTASLSLTGGTTNTADILVGPTSAVASGTGTVVARYSNTNTGALTVGLALSTIATTPVTIALPAGWYFAVRQTSGTVSIVFAFDQVVG